MADPTYVTIPGLTAATDGSINDNLLLEAAIPDGGSYVSRKVTKGQLVADLKEDLPYITVNGTALVINTGVVDGNEVEF
jgi:hypothetical protein